MNEYKTLIILDWDDTLFPTSWVIKNDINLLNFNTINKHIDFFNELDVLLHNILSTFLKYGEVVIVTNAMKKWVYISSNLIPNTKELINNKIPIISARDLYQNKFPDRNELWKEHTFKELIFKHAGKKILNIISIGDAEYEFYAIINFYKKYADNNTLFKTIRFKQLSTYDILIDQLKTLNKGILNIIEMKKNLDLNFIK